MTTENLLFAKFAFEKNLLPSNYGFCENVFLFFRTKILNSHAYEMMNKLK